MNLIVLIGSGAVGKMTVGQELMKITDYRLFHNHHMIEPVIEIFGKFDGAVVGKLREDIFDAFLKTDYSGLIFTYMWAFDMQSDWDYIKSVTDKFEATGGNVYYVELVADRAVRIERNKTENRLKNKASKRDIVVSEDRMLREETKYRLVSNDGEIPFENYMKIDNTNLEPSEVALMIKERFNLQGISVTELMNRVKLEGVREDEIEQLYDMQIKSFMSLYEKYHDEGSPAIESIERVRDRASQENRKYYFIVKDGARVGAINIGKRLSDPEEPCLYISPLFILPKYQNNPNFKVFESEHFKKEAGLVTFTPSVSEWVEKTNAVGLYVKRGKYGGTFAHKDIAFEFASAISPVFKLYLIKEFQRLKEAENDLQKLEWDAKRFLSKNNYLIQTDAVKNYLIPVCNYREDLQWLPYAEEADLLNVALFGFTAKAWREANPELAKKSNVRDYATINELTVLSNLESHNAQMIREGMDKKDRFEALKEIAEYQLRVLNEAEKISNRIEEQ